MAAIWKQSWCLYLLDTPAELAQQATIPSWAWDILDANTESQTFSSEQISLTNKSNQYSN